jgi:hypothetical protein
MSGLAYRRITIDLGSAFKKKAFKPLTGSGPDPVPASNPQQMSQDYKYRPGHFVNDPVPARPASSTYDIPSFTALDNTES